MSIILRPTARGRVRHWRSVVGETDYAGGRRRPRHGPPGHRNAVDVKWPNDIVVADSQAPTAAGRRWRKIAGILAEGQTFDGVLQHVVLGYGIDLQAAAYPPDIADRASSLEAELGRGVERAPVLVQTLAALRRDYDALLTGDAARVLDRWQELAPSSHGTRVSWTQGGPHTKARPPASITKEPSSWSRGRWRGM